MFRAKDLAAASASFNGKRPKQAAGSSLPADVVPLGIDSARPLAAGSELELQAAAQQRFDARQPMFWSVANVAPAIESRAALSDCSPRALLKAAVDEAQLLKLVLSPASSSSSSSQPPVVPLQLPSASQVATSLEPRAAALVRPLANGKHPVASYLGLRPLRTALPNDDFRSRLLLDVAPEAAGYDEALAAALRQQRSCHWSWMVPITLNLSTLTRKPQRAGDDGAGGDGAAAADGASPYDDGVVSFLWDAYDTSLTPLQYAVVLLAQKEINPATISSLGSVHVVMTNLTVVAAAITAQLLAFRERCRPRRAQVVKNLAACLAAAAPALAAAASARSSSPSSAAADGATDGGSSASDGAPSAAAGQHRPVLLLRVPALLEQFSTADSRIVGPQGTAAEDEGSNGQQNASTGAPGAAAGGSTRSAGRKRRRAVEEDNGYGGVSESKAGDDEDGDYEVEEEEVAIHGVVSASDLLFMRAPAGPPKSPSEAIGNASASDSISISNGTTSSNSAVSAASESDGSKSRRASSGASLPPSGHVGTLVRSGANNSSSSSSSSSIDGSLAITHSSGSNSMLLPSSSSASTGIGSDALPPWAPRAHPSSIVAWWLQAPRIDLTSVSLSDLLTGKFDPAAAAISSSSSSSTASTSDSVVTFDLDITTAGKRIHAQGLRLDLAALARPQAAPIGAAGTVNASSSASAAAPVSADASSSSSSSSLLTVVEELCDAALNAALGKRGSADVRERVRPGVALALHGVVNDVIAAIAAGAPDATAIERWLRLQLSAGTI